MVTCGPAVSQLSMHESDCCVAAQEALRITVMMANSRGGLAAVLFAGSHATSWGPRRCEWLCDAWQNRGELDCGAQAALLEKMAQLSDEYIARQVAVYRVRVIMKCSVHESGCWNDLFSTLGRTSYGLWIHPNGEAVYHECLGTYNQTQGLSVYDPAHRVWCLPSNDANSTSAILAWFLEPNSMPLTDEVVFGDWVVPVNQWFTLMPSVHSSSVALISSGSRMVYNHPIHSQNRQLTVFISGVTNNNDNPSPGLGVARSLRSDCCANQAIKLRLIGADFSSESVGLGDPVFDERLVFPSWEHCSARKHAEHVLDLLQSTSSSNHYSLYISCLDVETELLARELPTLLAQTPDSAEFVARVLIPSGNTLAQTRKPHIKGASELCLKTSDFLEVDQENNHQLEVHLWSLSNGFPILVKGQHHDAAVANSWSQVQASLGSLQKQWGPSATFLQRGVIGSEGSIAFSAYDGQLLSAVMMHKRVVTPATKVLFLFYQSKFLHL